MRTTLAIAAALALLTTIPTAAGDHIDDVGDRVEFDYVEPTQLDPSCASVATEGTDVRAGGLAFGHFLSDDPEDPSPPGPNVALDGACAHLSYNATYRLAAFGDEGEPAPFRVVVDFAPYRTCIGPTRALGTYEVTLEPYDPQGFACSSLTMDLYEVAPDTGTIAIERIR